MLLQQMLVARCGVPTKGCVLPAGQPPTQCYLLLLFSGRCWPLRLAWEAAWQMQALHNAKGYTLAAWLGPRPRPQTATPRARRRRGTSGTARPLLPWPAGKVRSLLGRILTTGRRQT